MKGGKHLRTIINSNKNAFEGMAIPEKGRLRPASGLVLLLRWTSRALSVSVGVTSTWSYSMLVYQTQVLMTIVKLKFQILKGVL